LALLIAHRGVVFFRDQDITIDQQLDLGRYYGPLHIHQNLGHPEGHPEVVVVENSLAKSAALLKNQQYVPANEWHSDVSNERQVRKQRATSIVEFAQYLTLHVCIDLVL
jgi:alpha-ketoglutarate-dependent taurine dioxygenase